MTVSRVDTGNSPMGLADVLADVAVTAVGLALEAMSNTADPAEVSVVAIVQLGQPPEGECNTGMAAAAGNEDEETVEITKRLLSGGLEAIAVREEHHE